MDKLIYRRITSNTAVKAYYVAGPDGQFLDDVISTYTGLLPCNWGTPPLSHEETGFFVDGKLMFFSSASRSATNKFDNGTRWISAKELLKQFDRWMFQIKDFTEPEIAAKIGRANGLIPMPYDYVGAVADFTILIDLVAEKKKIYCSKACHFVDTGNLRRISPRHDWKLSKNDGWRQCSGCYVETMAMFEGGNV